MAELLNMPMNGDSIDYGKYRYSTEVDGAVAFVEDNPSDTGKSAQFTGTDDIQVRHNIMDLKTNYSVLFWVKQSDTRLTITLNGQTKEIDIQPDKWTHIALIKEGCQVTIARDYYAVDTIELTDYITSIEIDQPDTGAEYAIGRICGLLIYDFNITLKEIQLLAQMSTAITYSVDGADFKDWDVYVSDSDGLLDLPKMKSPTSVDYADENGEIVDLEDIRIETREISLKCFIKATGKLDFATKVNSFLQAWSSNGLKRLMVAIDPTKPLVYDVYRSSSVSIDKQWHDNIMVGEFTLSLTEPAPVKKVYNFSATTDTPTATFTMTQTTPLGLFLINWGDGEQSEWTTETATITHTYTETGNYYITINGTVDKVTVSSTNTTKIWDKI